MPYHNRWIAWPAGGPNPAEQLLLEAGETDIFADPAWFDLLADLLGKQQTAVLLLAEDDAGRVVAALPSLVDENARHLDALANY